MIEIQLFETDELEDLLREVAEWVEAEKLKEVIDVVVFYSYEYGDWNAKVYYRARNK